MIRQKSISVIFSSFTAIVIAACGPLRGEMAQPGASATPGTSLPVGTNVVININYPGGVINQPMPGYTYYPTYPLPGATTPPAGVVAMSISVQAQDVVLSFAQDVLLGRYEWKPGMPEQSKPDVQYSWTGGMWAESYTPPFANVFGPVVTGQKMVVFKNMMTMKGLRFTPIVLGPNNVKVYAALDNEHAAIVAPNMGLAIEEVTDAYGHKSRRLAVL
ncbi:hypothetical protein HY620_02395 [Candidatus Uhrbacteria bacterium]|nr:hypothetical protein [Candidatus Uhrbacteria bacterium]